MSEEPPPRLWTTLAAGMRVVPAVALLIGWYVVVIALMVLSAAMVVGLMLSDAHSTGTMSGAHLANAVGLATLFLVLAYSLAASSWRTAPVYPASVAVPRPGRSESSPGAGEASQLWRLVTEVAGKAGVPPPAQMRLVAEANAWVTEQPRAMGLLHGNRTLYIGVPLLIGLTTDELSAVLGHEYGHYAGGHTRFGAIAYRGASAFQETIGRVQRSSKLSVLAATMTTVPLTIINGYARLYYRITFALLRSQEFAADRTSANVVGDATVTMSALEAVHAHGLAWENLQGRFLSLSASAGIVPDDPFSVYEQMLGDEQFQAVFARWRTNPVAAPTTRYDTHPSLYDRLSALSRLEPGSAPARGKAVELLGAGPSLRAEVAQAYFGTSKTPSQSSQTLPWAKWVRIVAERTAAASAVHLADTARTLMTDAARPECSDRLLGDVLHLLDAGCGHQLAIAYAEVSASRPGNSAAGQASAGSGSGSGSAARSIFGLRDRIRHLKRRRASLDTKTEPISTDQARKLLVDALILLISHDLVAQGRSTWRLDWTGQDGSPAASGWGTSSQAEFRDLISTALDQPTEVSRLRMYLAEVGVDPEGLKAPHSAYSADPSTEAPQSAVTSTSKAKSALSAKLHTRRDRILAAAAATAGAIVISIIVAAIAYFSPAHEAPFINPSLIPPSPVLYSPDLPDDGKLITILQPFATNSSAGHSG